MGTTFDYATRMSVDNQQNYCYDFDFTHTNVQSQKIQGDAT